MQLESFCLNKRNKYLYNTKFDLCYSIVLDYALKPCREITTRSMKKRK